MSIDKGSQFVLSYVKTRARMKLFGPFASDVSERKGECVFIADRELLSVSTFG